MKPYHNNAVHRKKSIVDKSALHSRGCQAAATIRIGARTQKYIVVTPMQLHKRYNYLQARCMHIFEF